MTYTELNLFIPYFLHRTDERITKLYRVRLIHLLLLNCVQHSSTPLLQQSTTPILQYSYTPTLHTLYIPQSAIPNPQSSYSPRYPSLTSPSRMRKKRMIRIKKTKPLIIAAKEYSSGSIPCRRVPQAIVGRVGIAPML